MPLSVLERVPGVLFRDLAPLPEALPRLDVAAFLGFAERGPVDRPVSIEDRAAYERWFGGDVTLVQGETRVRPYLSRAVTAFFENGGRRCYVVRVCGTEAARAEFTVPTLARLDGAPVKLRASSPGAWANALCVATRLNFDPLDREDAHWAGDHSHAAFSVSRSTRWARGDVLRIIDQAGGRWLMVVERVEVRRTRCRRVLASGTMTFDFGAESPPETPPGSPPGTYDGSVRRIERLTFDLIAELRASEGGARSPTDAARREQGETIRGLGFAPGHPRYWIDALGRESVYLAPPEPERWELRGGRAVAPVTLPHGMPGFGERPSFLEPVAHGSDDFEGFSPELFAPSQLDAMAAGPLLDLASKALEEEYRASRGGYVADPVRLRGLMSLIPVSEVALVAIPDALHLARARIGHDNLKVRASAKEPVAPALACPVEFSACAPPVAPPHPPRERAPDDLVPPPDANEYGFTAADALEIQRRAIRLCAQRGDMVAVIALPLAVEDPFDWRTRLDDPATDMSYAALYYPWTLVRDDSSPDAAALRLVPPDGAACGAIAKREVHRHVWIAPANDPLHGILGLEPMLSAAQWADFIEANVNVVRPLPGDFRIMSARTLSDERDYSQLNVRRLLIMLRKLLYRWGLAYVFEPHTPQFRSAFRRRLERELEQLFRAGAFAGASSAESFQVETEGEVNTPAGADGGRFIALVKVAPSWPMEFLEVQLVRTGEGVLQLVET